MASDFTSAYLAKREKEKKQTASGSSSGSANVQNTDSKHAQTSFSDAYLAKRYNDVSLADRQAQSVVDDIGYDPDTGTWYSISWRDELARRRYNPTQIQSVFEQAQRLQNAADALNPGEDSHRQRPTPDYGLIDNYNQSSNNLSLAARSRALAQKALADYEKQYRTQLDSYGPYIDGSGKDVAGQYDARKKAVDDANQAYEDALALYQKDQWLSEKARRDVDDLESIAKLTKEITKRTRRVLVDLQQPTKQWQDKARNTFVEAVRDENELNALRKQFLRARRERILAGQAEATPDSITAYADILNNFERIGDYAMRVNENILGMRADDVAEDVKHAAPAGQGS